MSSVKWSDPGQFLKAQGKLFLSFPCTLFYIFLTSKITNRAFKKSPGLHYYHYFEQVIIKNSYFDDFEQVVIEIVILLSLNKSLVILLILDTS